VGAPGLVQGCRGQDCCERVVRALRAKAEVTARAERLQPAQPAPRGSTLGCAVGPRTLSRRTW
jgi:hypothetical protein